MEVEFRKRKELEALPPPDGAYAGCEKESEDHGIPAAKKQKKSWEAPGGSGNTAPEKLHSDKPEWGIVYDALRSHWRVHTGLSITWYNFKEYGGDETKAYEAALHYLQREMSRNIHTVSTASRSYKTRLYTGIAHDPLLPLGEEGFEGPVAALACR